MSWPALYKEIDYIGFVFSMSSCWLLPRATTIMPCMCSLLQFESRFPSLRMQGSSRKDAFAACVRSGEKQRLLRYVNVLFFSRLFLARTSVAYLKALPEIGAVQLSI